MRLRTACIAAVGLTACFKSTPVVVAPATPQEAQEIEDTLDSTVWYVTTWTDDAGKRHDDGLEAFAFFPGGQWPTVITTVYRGGFFHQIADTGQHWDREMQGKNLILHFPTMHASTRQLRVEKWSPDAMVLFDYDFTRTYDLRRTPPDASGPVNVPTGKYVTILLSKADAESTAYPPLSCDLEAPPDGAVAKGTCGALKDWTFACTVPDPAKPDRCECKFTGPKSSWAASLRLNPDGSFIGKWRANESAERAYPIAMFHRP